MNFKGKILLVDDEAHIRKFMSVLLRGLGSPFIIEAKNGHEAVELYAQERPELVLLDVNMPLQDGLETLRKILALDPDALVVMLTSLTTRQVVEEAAGFGAAHYLRKETPPDEILATLREILESSAAPDEDATPTAP